MHSHHEPARLPLGIMTMMVAELVTWVVVLSITQYHCETFWHAADVTFHK